MSKGKTSKCLKGVSYGSMKMENNSMDFHHNDLTIIKIPYEEIAITHCMNKNEILFELKNDSPDTEQTLCEFRLLISNNEAETINEKILEKMGLNENDQELIALFEDLKFLIPRGKHSVSFFEKKLKFHGGTFNYKSDFSNIRKVYLLPKPKSDILSLVFTFKQPLKQGSTRHSYFILEFFKDDKTSIKINLNKKEIKEKFSELDSEYDGLTFDIFTKIFKAIAHINIIIPSNFKSFDGEACVKCIMKNTSGYLYFLQNSLIFLPKANIYFKTDEIKIVEFYRIGSSKATKSFDIKIEKKDLSFSAEFTGIDKNEYEPIEKYFSSKNIPTVIKNETFINESEDESPEKDSKKNSKSNDYNEEDKDDEDDEDYKGDEGSDSEN